MKQINKIHPTLPLKKLLYYAECWITALLMYNPSPLTNKRNEHCKYRSLNII